MEPMLYDPLVPIAQPMVKWAVEVTRLQDLPRIVHRAAEDRHHAADRTGVHQSAGRHPGRRRPRSIWASRRAWMRRRGHPTRRSIGWRTACSKRAIPVLIAGHELSTYDALREAAELAELLGAPVYQQTVPYSAQFLSEHPAFLGCLTRNQQQVRAALQPYDLLVFLGADVLRMSVHSAVDPLPEGKAIVQISERDWELAKNYPAEIAIKANIKETLRALLPVLRANAQPGARGASRAQAGRVWRARTGRPSVSG